MSRTPIHPGEILKDELAELDISGAALSRQILVPENRINQILAQKRSISADTALRLGRWFGTTPDFWANLQKSYELRKAEQEIGSEIQKITPRQQEQLPPIEADGIKDWFCENTNDAIRLVIDRQCGK